MIDKTQFEGLTPSQSQAVFHQEGPLQVLAGPGSGKTRVITARIAALVESGVFPYQICAITFTNKAAQEMRQRVEAGGGVRGAWISTFHSFCVRVLRQYADEAGIGKSFTIYDTADQKKCVKEAVKACELDTTNFAPAQMLNALSTLKNKLVSVQAFEADAQDYFSRTLARVYQRYQEILKGHNALDFDDLLVKTAFLLEQNDTVCEALSERFRFLLIDEYQDTNHAQYRIAKRLAAAHGNIMATGDPDQSIYRWRGADIQNILAFEKDWPEAKIVRLEENFRSSAAILKVADSLIAHNRHRKEKTLKPTKPAGRPVKLNGYEDELEEAHAVAAEIQHLVSQGATYNQVALFYRVNAMSRALEEALIQGKIPYQVVRGVEFYNRKEIKDLLAYLKVLVNPEDEVSLLRIINTPARGLGKVTLDKVKALSLRTGGTLYQALGQVEQLDALAKAPKGKILAFYHMMEQFKRDVEGPVAPLAQRVIEEAGLEGLFRHAGEEGQDALDNLEELVNSAARYDQQAEEPGLLDYLQEISLFSDADTYDGSSNRVALMTLHAAKGLEFPHAFILGLEEGILPHERSVESEDDLEEERRLLFVGVTRAEENLNLSYVRYRTVHGQTIRSIPSQFLYELGLGFSGSTGQGRKPSLSGQTRSARRRTAPKQDAPFTDGELVNHAKFGLGRVQKFTDMGDNSIVTVSFNSGMTKNLMLKFAKLEKAQN
ncbi:MAG: UvrD-helicase domain-containing protein [Planctomycetes bacterium]|nr:UvrD-helicase domain-containing protein [Planctomycetota bacterium]